MVRSSWEGMVGAEDIKKIAANKKKLFHEKTIPKGQEEYYADRGWVEKRRNPGGTIRIEKRKSHDEEFEDKVWHTFSRMGFNLMNSDRNFRIPLAEDSLINPVQIDVFVADSEVAVITECKSCATPEKKSMKSVITNIIGIKEEVINQVKKYTCKNIKVGFALATNNITLSKEDEEYAEKNGICVVNEFDIDYYSSLADNLGKASKYQFLSDVFKNRDIPNLRTEVPAIRGKMGLDTFYSFVIEPAKLLPISYVSHRTKNSVDVEYQRMIKKKRLDGITEYVKEKNGLFPNSIILNIHSDKSPMVFKQTSKGSSNTVAVLGYLSLPNRYKSAWVIDGQHRLYGFANTDIADKVTIPVIAFEDLGFDKQAEMFIDINSKQVKVSNNLLEELHADLHWNSPKEDEKMSALISKVVITLSRTKTSPFYEKIKFSSDKGNDKPVSLTSLTTALRKTKLFGDPSKQLFGALYSIEEPRMNRSLGRAVEVLSEFYSIFSTVAKENWDLGSKEGGYLCTSNAVTSEMFLLAEIIKHISRTQGVDPRELKTDDLIEQVRIFVEPVAYFFRNAGSEEVKEYRKRLGAQGQQDSAYEMMEIVKDMHSQFNPPGLEKYIQNKESGWREKSRDIVDNVQLLISNNVVSTLKSHYNENWWREGVPQNIREKIAVERETSVVQRDHETYFMLIHYESIVSKNWGLFRTIYGIGNTQKGKGEQLAWFARLNDIRNKVYHPERGAVFEEEYQFLKEMEDVLEKRIKENSV